MWHFKQWVRFGSCLLNQPNLYARGVINLSLVEVGHHVLSLLCGNFLQSFYVHLLMCVLYMITCCSLLLQVLCWHLYVPITESAERGDALKTTSSVHVHVYTLYQSIYCVLEHYIPTDLDVSISLLQIHYVL